MASFQLFSNGRKPTNWIRIVIVPTEFFITPAFTCSPPLTFRFENFVMKSKMGIYMNFNGPHFSKWNDKIQWKIKRKKSNTTTFKTLKKQSVKLSRCHRNGKSLSFNMNRSIIMSKCWILTYSRIIRYIVNGIKSCKNSNTSIQPNKKVSKYVANIWHTRDYNAKKIFKSEKPFNFSTSMIYHSGK